MTPMMSQYMDIKEQYKDCILFYRLGDFYEMFYGDAHTASDVLGLTLTGRDCGEPDRAPMCGVPYHSCDTYIAKLVESGYKVAICEQVQDPKECKGIVERKVVKVVTPGTITIPDVVDKDRNNYLVCIFKKGGHYGLSATDVSTGELHATEFTSESAKSDMISEVTKYAPSEIIYSPAFEEDVYSNRFIQSNLDVFMQKHESDNYMTEKAAAYISGRFPGRDTADNISGYPLATSAAAALLDYLEKVQMTGLEHINTVDYYSTGQYLGLDSTARSNLELVKSLRDRTKRGSLLGILDKTKTAMGARMLANWIQQPLVSCGHITRRSEAVDELYKKHDLREKIRDALKSINDIERLVSKFEYLTVNGRDMNSLKNSIRQLPAVMKLLSECESGLLVEAFTEFDLLTDIANLIEVSICDDPPFSIREGEIIRDGYDSKLDEWRSGKKGGAARLTEMEASERERTGIKNLKISFNKVFGYYIEVTRSYFDLVPDNYIRKQTLANAERYITEELKEVEDLVLRSDEKIVAREYNLFCDLRDKIKVSTERIQKTAKAISTIDVLANLAEIAVKNNYVRPEVNPGDEIEIRDGRHPVVESFLKSSMFVPNDTVLDCNDNMFSMITGPNMAGKSTYMRQTALIVIMAQMGSFVPAKYAKIGIVDKVFTRIGASDDLASGQSTFMVEMNEVAGIIKNATSKSLLILDEIGRGTSTFDGMAIAWAITEYVADKKKLGARTLFATHYHELISLEDKIPGVKNYCIAAKKKDDDIVFLRKIIRGGTDDSYGIEVAKLAGVADEIIKNAKKILKKLEGDAPEQPKAAPKAEMPKESDMQFDMFDSAKDELIEEIKKIDLNVLTPIETMNVLFNIKKKADAIN